MTVDTHFRWHASARLFCGAEEIKRADPPHLPGFVQITSTSTPHALQHLALVIQRGQGFCMSPSEVPLTQTVPIGSFVTLTGGSSGTPKAILRTQASWCHSFDRNAGLFGYTTHDSIAVLGSLSHSLALYGVLEALHLGLDAHVLADMSPQRQQDLIADAGIRILYATPTQLRLLCLGQTTRTQHNVRLILCGGGALDDCTRRAVQKQFANAAIHVFYGAAETSFITMSGPNTPPGSVGPAYPGVDLRILDDAGQETGGIGEVWVRSPYLFDRYLTHNTSPAQWRAGFISVGEIGTLDAQGNLWLKGRKTRMVQIADQIVFPEVIEDRIASHPEVTSCAVVALPDALRGHRLIAVIEGDTSAPLTADLRHLCQHDFGPLSTPRVWLFKRDLPRLPSGKTDIPTVTRWAEGQL